MFAREIDACGDSSFHASAMCLLRFKIQIDGILKAASAIGEI